MKPWTLFVILPTLLAQAPSQAESLLQSPPAPALPPQSKIVQEHMRLACGTAPPASIAEWRKTADAIVHVRINAQVTYDHEIPTLGTSEVITAQEVTVMDVFKADRRAGVAGSSMTILQAGGTIARSDGLHRYRTNRLDILPLGSEWVLFLYWNKYLEGFGIERYEDGAFQITGDTIKTLGEGVFADKWRGQPASAFLATLESTR